MKNTMKMKSLLSFFVPAAMMSLMVAGCSDYDNGYDTNAIKFAQEFRKTFGDIDPEQDWNLAERGTVTVSTMKESEVKIYAKTGDAFSIVGDYEGVKGTRMLGFDMVEGTKEIIVSDGTQGIKTTPGGVVAFGQGTRAIIWEGTREDVTVSALTEDVEINDITYPKSKTPTDAQIQSVLVNQVPEMQTNIGREGIYSDFHYISNGSFIIYPYYWNTSSINTVGVYYTDAAGNYHEVDIYTANGEREYVEGYGEPFAHNIRKNQNPSDDNNAYWRPNDWHLNINGSEQTVPNDNFHKNGWSGETDESGLKVPFIEYWKNGQSLGTATISKTPWKEFKHNHDYLVMVEARLMSESTACDGETGSVTFKANDASIVMTNNGFHQTAKYNNHDVIYSSIDGTKRMWVKCKSDDNGKIKVSFELNNIKANWFAFKDLKIFDAEHFDAGYLTGRNDNFYQSNDRGQGVKVDIPEGVEFGMYVKKTDNNSTGTNGTNWTLYSQMQKNIDKGYEFDQNKYCYASTFYMGDQMFIGLEDWPNGDCDLNDVVFAFDGCKPTIINEDPKSSTWLLACEDLGGSFDIDYNDVVFVVEHISGQEKAILTPLAAGGTLASYIYFQDPLGNGNRNKCFGEIHQLFGAPQGKSGEYEIINAYSRYDKIATPIEFAVDKDWTMAYYSTGESGGTSYGGDVNMGGFEIRTLPLGNEAPFELDINSGAFSGASKIQAAVHATGENVPYILCIPYPYTRYNYNGKIPGEETGTKTTYVWAWPVEYQTICDENGAGPYPDFSEWVKNHNNNTDWYKNKAESYSSATVEDLIYLVSSMSEEDENNVNNQKQPSKLSNKGNITIKLGETVNLAANLTNANKSQGALSYSFVFNGNTYSWGSELTPNSMGVHTVTVTQAADDHYEAGSTTFTVTVESPSSGTKTSDFAVAVDNAPRGNGSTNWDDANDHEVYLPEGTTLTLRPHHYNSGGTVTVGAFDNGNMSGVTTSTSVGATITENVVISAQNLTASGTASITFHYSGNDEYAAKDITYTIKVASVTHAEIKVSSSPKALNADYKYNGQSFTGNPTNEFWLQKTEDNRLVLQRYSGITWNLEQVPGDPGYYYLNAAGNGYLYVGGNGYSPAYQTSIPGNSGKFTFVNGKLQCKSNSLYLGNDPDGYVYLNKTSDNAITWTLVDK